MPLSTRTVLHVSHEQAEARSRRFALRAAGLTVHGVPDWSSARRLAERQHVDLVVIEPDIEAAAALPDIPAIELARGWEPLAGATDLQLAVYALLRLNAAEQALRESDARFRNVADAAPVLIWSARPDGGRDYFNEPWLQFTGRSIEQELDEGWLEGVHAEDRARCLAGYRSALAARTDIELEYRLRNHEGRYRWVLEVAVPRYTPDGIFAGCVGSCIDITERHESEAGCERLLWGQVAQREAAQAGARRSALLAEISELLSAGFDSGPALEALASRGVPLLADACVIHLHDEHGVLRPVSWSCAYPPAQQAFAAYTARGEIGTHAVDPLRKSIRTGRPVVLEALDTKSAHDAWIEPAHLDLLQRMTVSALFVVPLIAFGERLGAAIFLLCNPARAFVPEDVRLAQEVAGRIALGVRNRLLYADAERGRVQAEEANRVKDEFLATLSHELRQPVHAISGWVRLLKTGRLSPEKTLRAVQMIEQNVALQARIVKDLLDVSAMITGQLALETATITLQPVIAAAVESLQPTLESKRIELVQRIDPRVPAIEGDARRLEQVVWNLLYNAIKFSPHGGRIELSLAALGTSAQIAVIDNGPGIDPRFLPHVFDPFRQEDGTTTRRHGGLGLGLAIVRHIVELHGGEVRAQNATYERGAMFMVSLPCAAPVPSSPSIAAAGGA